MIDQQVSFQHTRRVRWRDTDASGFAHMAAFITWMEETEYQFLRSRELSVVLRDEKGLIGFPRLSSELNIENQVEFDDELCVTLRLSEFDGKQLSYEFLIVRIEDQIRIATGKFTMACCRFPDNQMPYAILIPVWIEQKLLPTQGTTG